MKSKLQELGLTKSEIAVYLELLRLGEATAGTITDQAGIHRRNVYDAIEGLSKKGLIGHIVKDKVKHFRAASPVNLLQIVEEEKEKLKAKEESISSIVSELMMRHERPREKTSITIYKGIKGVKTVFEDILNTGKENLVLGAHKPPGILANYLINFHSRRVKTGIKNRLIFNNDFERAKGLAKMPRTEVRLMPQKHEKTTCINIYGSKVAILSWSEPVSIVIEDMEIADNFRHYFELLWKLL